MNQITNEQDLIGKTIAKVIQSEGLWVSFTDKSFVIFEVITESTGFNSKTKVRIDDFPVDNSYNELVSLNLITKEVCEQALIEEDMKIQKNLKAGKERARKREEERELEMLKKLKTKYE